MRLSEADIAIIGRAARRRGHSRTRFVHDAAVRAAEEAIMEDALVRLSPAAFKVFAAVIAAPHGPVPQIVETLKRKAPWERERRR